MVKDDGGGLQAVDFDQMTPKSKMVKVLSST